MRSSQLVGEGLRVPPANIMVQKHPSLDHETPRAEREIEKFFRILSKIEATLDYELYKEEK